MIKRASLVDVETLSKLANFLWKDSTIDKLSRDFSELLINKDSLVLLKLINNDVIGFAQCQLRYDYVEGTTSSPVGYLEGIYINEKYRKHGFAKELLFECEKWAKSKNCTEFASDCEIDNIESFLFHKAIHFTEANRIICFTKKL